MTIYIAIEGPDGSGKTTLANYLNDHKKEISSHLDVISHRSFEKGSSGIARSIGKITSKIVEYGECHGIEGIANLGYALCELPYLFAKGKAESKGVVLSDREFSISAQIWLRVAYPKFSFAIPLINHFSEVPDDIIYLKIDTDTAYERVKEKNSCQKHETKEDLDKIVSGYELKMASLDAIAKKVFTIDASKSIESIAEEAMGHIREVLALHEKIFGEEYSSFSADAPTNITSGTPIIQTSLKKKLFKEYEEGRIDSFEGAELLNLLNNKEMPYILENLALCIGIGLVTPPGIGSLISCPARFFWTIGNRLYLEAYGDKDKAKIHSLDVALIGAIPWIGGYAHLLTLYKRGLRNPKMYKLIAGNAFEQSKIIIKEKIKKTNLKVF